MTAAEAAPWTCCRPGRNRGVHSYELQLSAGLRHLVRRHMSLSLKSGTKSFHGELFEFNRNTAYDANSYFNKLSTPVTPRATVKYNIFGGNIGGPLIIPHLYNTSKQKTFFFWNEEGRRIVNSAGTNVENTIDPADIPSAGRNLTYVPPGFDPDAFIVVPNISTSTSYYQKKLKPLDLTPGRCWNGPTLFDSQGNVSGCQQPQVIPASLFDNDGILYLNSPVFPRPNVASQDKNITSLSVPIDVRDDIVRIDHKFSDKWTILAHYIHDAATQDSTGPFFGFSWASYNTVTSVLTNPSSSAAVKLSGIITPNLLVEASINYDGNIIDITNRPNSKLPAGWSIAPVSPAFAITGNSLPSMSLMGPYGVVEQLGTTPWHNAAEDYEPKIDVSWTRSKHTMKFGFSYNRYTKNQQIFGNQQGLYTPSSTTNDSLMDILLGLTANYSQSQSTPIRHYVTRRHRSMRWTTGTLGHASPCSSALGSTHCRTHGNATTPSQTSIPRPISRRQFPSGQRQAQSIPQAPASQ